MLWLSDNNNNITIITACNSYYLTSEQQAESDLTRDTTLLYRRHESQCKTMLLHHNIVDSSLGNGTVKLNADDRPLNSIFIFSIDGITFTGTIVLFRERSQDWKSNIV